MPSVSIPGTNERIFYTLHGPESSDKAPLLFIMGLLGDGHAWHFQAEFFAQQGFRVCTFDNRGVGNSTVPKGRYTTTMMARDALHLVDHLQWREFHLVGHSMGGMISQELSLLATERLLSLTLISTHAGGRWTPWHALSKWAATVRARTKEQKLDSLNALLYAKATLERQESRDFLRTYHEKRAETRAPPSPRGALGQAAAVGTHYMRYQRLLKLRLSNIPTLIVVGTEDNLVDVQNSRRLHEVLGGRFVELEGGHGLTEERPQELNAAILDLVNRAGGRVTGATTEQHAAMRYVCTHTTPCVVHGLAGFAWGAAAGAAVKLALVLLTVFFGVGASSSLLWRLVSPMTLRELLVLFGCASGMWRAAMCTHRRLRMWLFVRAKTAAAVSASGSGDSAASAVRAPLSPIREADAGERSAGHAHGVGEADDDSDAATGAAGAGAAGDREPLLAPLPGPQRHMSSRSLRRGAHESLDAALRRAAKFPAAPLLLLAGFTGWLTATLASSLL